MGKNGLLQLVKSVPEEDALALLEAIFAAYMGGSGSANLAPFAFVNKSWTIDVQITAK